MTIKYNNVVMPHDLLQTECPQITNNLLVEFWRSEAAHGGGRCVGFSRKLCRSLYCNLSSCIIAASLWCALADKGYPNLRLSVFISFPLVCLCVHLPMGVGTILIQDDLHLRYSCDEYL